MLRINNEIVNNTTIIQIVAAYHNNDIIEGAEIYMELPKKIAMQPVPIVFGDFTAPLYDLLFRGGDNKNNGRFTDKGDSVVFLLTNELNPDVDSEPLKNENLRKWFSEFLVEFPLNVATRSGFNELVNS